MEEKPAIPDDDGPGARLRSFRRCVLSMVDGLEDDASGLLNHGERFG
jgi:hypothetical protein